MAPPPVAVVCVGMAGSGKTTFMQRINSYLHSLREPPYVINLDPAVRNVPFDSNIDIRDSIDYKEVMSQYNLGPNGGILTSLNLFATKVDQVMEILEKRCGIRSDSSDNSSATPTTSASSTPKSPIQNIIVDTPGQIEVFVWSASGQILLSALASSFPTVLAYIIDTPRTASTSTFMSNMLYACSILYKTKLPMVLVFNKTDVQSAEFAKEWMTDFEAFQAALQREEDTGIVGGAAPGATGPVVGGSGYMGSLLNSMSLVLEEFYKHLSVVGVSSVTGDGTTEFFEAVKEKAQEFEKDYRPELERRKQEKEKDQGRKKDQELGNLMKDLKVRKETGRSESMPLGQSSREKQQTISDMEDEGDEDVEAEMVDPDSANEDDDNDDDDEDGLQRRYERVMEKTGTDGAGMSESDASFARYVRSGNIDNE